MAKKKVNRYKPDEIDYTFGPYSINYKYNKRKEVYEVMGWKNQTVGFALPIFNGILPTIADVMIDLTRVENHFDPKNNG